MLRRISVETGLDDVKAYLGQRGYEVVDMADCVQPVEAVVYTGKELAGQATARAVSAQNTLLINAAGLSPEQVEAYLNN